LQLFTIALVMARVKIDLPAQFIFSTSLSIRVYDLNYGAHLGNDRVLALMHEARVQMLKYLGFNNERNGIEGKGIIMSDAAVVYKAEGFYDDNITIKIGATDLSRVSFDLVYLMEKNNGKELARGKTGIVCFDYELGKAISIPEPLKNKLVAG